MSHFSSRTAVFATAAAMAVGLSLPAAAANPAYVGKWATSAKACKLPSDTLDAPVVMSRLAYNQFETHCDFKTLKKSGAAWKAKVVCLVEGAKEKDTMTITASATKMSIRWGLFPTPLRYVRCK